MTDRGRITVWLLGTLGVVAVAAGIVAVETDLLAPSLSPVLLAVGGVCLVGGLFLWLLVPDAIATATARDITRSLSDNQMALVTAHGLRTTPVYVPTGRDAETDPDDAVRALYLAGDTDPPSSVDPDTTVLGSEPSSPGLALRPSAGFLLGTLFADLPNGPSDDPARLGTQLADAATESFDLAARVSADADGETLTFRVREPTFDATAADTPVGSLLAAGLAASLDRPVSMAVDSESAPVVVTCQLLGVDSVADDA